MDGLLSSAAAVEEALRARLAFYGELEHSRLLQLERQLDLLDGAAPAELAPLQEAYAAAFEEARSLSRRLQELRGAGREREREIDMLRFQIGEIEAAEVRPWEDETLVQDRERLRHAGKLLERAGGALNLLAGENEAAALDAVRVAQRLVGEAAAFEFLSEREFEKLSLAVCVGAGVAHIDVGHTRLVTPGGVIYVGALLLTAFAVLLVCSLLLIYDRRSPTVWLPVLFVSVGLSAGAVWAAARGGLDPGLWLLFFFGLVYVAVVAAVRIARETRTDRRTAGR